MPDLTQLLASRDQLNADIAKLQSATAVDQTSVDQVTQAVQTVDTAVQSLLVPQAPKFDFTKLDQNFNSLSENVKTLEAPGSAFPNLTQADVDALTAALQTANGAFKVAFGIL